VPRGAGSLHPLGLNPGSWTIRETKPRSHLTSALQMPPSLPILLLPAPSGRPAWQERETGRRERGGENADLSRDCYFNEISLNAGTRGRKRVDGWPGGGERAPPVSPEGVDGRERRDGGG